MKRIAGFAAALVVVVAACSDAPTAPGKNPLIADKALTKQEKNALADSKGVSRPGAANRSNRQYVSTPPSAVATPMWMLPAVGTDLEMEDDDAQFVCFQFNFAFFGRNYNCVWVGSNGYLTFDAAFTQFSPTTLPSTPVPHAIIAGAFEDWLPAFDDEDGNGAVLFYVTGQAPKRRLVVSWVGMAVFGEGDTPRGTFQIQLMENRGLNMIVLSYQTMSRTQSHWGTPVTAGVSSGPFTAPGNPPGTMIIGQGLTMPALQGHSICLINLGGTYRRFDDTICSIFMLP